jgi:hypothetical protein
MMNQAIFGCLTQFSDVFWLWYPHVSPFLLFLVQPWDPSENQAVLLLHLAGFTTISRDLVLPGTAAMGPLRQARWFWALFWSRGCHEMRRFSEILDAKICQESTIKK